MAKKSSKTLLRQMFRWEGGAGRPPKTLTAEDLVGLGTGSSLVSMETSYYERMRLPYTREDMYRLYDELDELAEISGVLWAYAEDACQRSLEHEGASVWFQAKNKAVVKELERCFYENLEVDEWLMPATRDTGKYGDVFGALESADDEGVISITDWPFPHYVKRIEQRSTGVLLGFLDENRLRQGPAIAQSTNLEEMILKPWEMVHFRHRAQNRVPRNEERWIYGTSLLYSVRRSGRRKMLYSDLLFLYRLRNSFDRRVFYIDVGSTDYQQATEIIRRWRRALEKKSYVNFDANLMRITNDPMSLGEQIFWPRRKDSNSAVEVIPGNPNVADMADVDAEENSLFAGLRAPKEYFGFGREGGLFDRDKGLTLKDMRWGRAVASLQRGIRNGLHRIGEIHLARMGIDCVEDKNNKFTVQMVNPSVLETMQHVQAAADMANLGKTMYDIGMEMGLKPEEWREHILKQFFGMSQADINELAAEIPEPATPPGFDGGGMEVDTKPEPDEKPEPGDDDEDDDDDEEVDKDRPAKPKKKKKEREARGPVRPKKLADSAEPGSLGVPATVQEAIQEGENAFPELTAWFQTGEGIAFMEATKARQAEILAEEAVVVMQEEEAQVGDTQDDNDQDAD